MEEAPVATMSVKELTSRSRRELREGYPHIAVAPFLCFLIAVVFGVLSGMYISLGLTKSLVSEKEVFFPHVDELLPSYASHSYNATTISSSSSSCSSNNTTITTTSSASVGNQSSGLGEWIAPKELWHSMSDQELMWRASMVPQIEEYPYERKAKVAFMFLARGRMPLRPIWERFFKGHQGLFSIYLHTAPDYSEVPPPTSVFFRRRVPSKPVEWGRATMIDAERRLIANALLDSGNERFVLLSESCIPLFNFTTVYNYLTGSNQSFLSSFDDPRKMGRGRYNKRMLPMITIHDWRKGSQWFEVHHKLAVKIVADTTYYPIFREHCKPSCYMDEHYLPTLVTKLLPELNSYRSVTWVDWSRGGSHPTTFRHRDVSEGFLNKIRHGSKCLYNGNGTSLCFLFARKFDGSTLGPLLRILPSLLGFNPLGLV